MKKKNLFQRLFIGIKKGLFTPTLPEYIIVIHNNVFIRIFRVVSGICALLIITHKLESLGDGLLYLFSLYICIIINIIYSIYMIFINYHRIKHIYKVLKSDALDIRNSPLDRMARIAARLIMCSKGACELMAPIGLFYGAMCGLDELRTLKGHEPIFKPFIADIIIPDTELSSLSKERLKYISQLTQNSLEKRCCEEELEIVEKLFKNNIINEDEAIEWKQYIINKQSLLDLNSLDLNRNILDNLNKSNNVIINRK